MTNSTLRVRHIMTRDVITLEQNEKLILADDVMKLGRIRHIPVVDDQHRLVGIVSQRDLFHSGLLRALGYGALEQRKVLDMVSVKEAMKAEVLTASPDTLLREAAQVMLKHKVGCLVVTENSKIVGIVTEADFVKYLAER